MSRDQRSDLHCWEWTSEPSGLLYGLLLSSRASCQLCGFFYSNSAAYFHTVKWRFIQMKRHPDLCWALFFCAIWPLLRNLETLLPHAAENHQMWRRFKPARHDWRPQGQSSYTGSKSKVIILFAIYLFPIFLFVFYGFLFVKARCRVQNSWSLWPQRWAVVLSHLVGLLSISAA